MREMRGQFQKLFRTRQGVKFNGELNAPANTAQDNYRPRRTLTVAKAALVTTGDVVTAEGSSYLLSLSSDLSDTRQFKAYQITHRVSWTRKADQVDFVTGLPKDADLVILDDALPIVVEYGQVVQNLGIETDKYRVLTGSDVKPGDRLGAWLVMSRTDMNGLNLLEVT